jgi:hypothetical protein
LRPSIGRQPALQGAHRHGPQENDMSAVMFTLLFGLLSGIAAFVGSAPFETVLMLGLLGLMHLSVVAARKADSMIVREDIQR